ncbi:putative phosphoribosylaminoimidazole carboxylase [Erysiphe necator]|uniref:phosphoribosylaminoimidazole carboxylase n=1 Tax=Uncinula necator TaxID=52586 RepID=A0A0B1PE93_UNCNE|nr:putative phosphoribosylaminoimidazole carboxylase [Erysiphe necator]
MSRSLDNNRVFFMENEAPERNPKGRVLDHAKPTTSLSTATMTATTTALIAVTMGSDSDLPILKPGLELLKTMQIPFSITITSAHRTPQRMIEFASSAESKGIKVIIAAAGGAAHLPGMIASCTCLPVIGIPIKASTLDGTDSLLSIVQMPRGVPVATVAINNSVNAALLAVRILGTSDETIKNKVIQYSKQMSEEVLSKAEKMEKDGFSNYCA